MKKIYIREARHIVATFSDSKKTTGYNVRSKSAAYSAVRNILKWHWVESVSEHDGFMFVKPTNILLNMNFQGKH